MTRDVVQEHLDAFNAHDTERLLATLDSRVVWRTGTDSFHGTDTLRDSVFDAPFWDLRPSLDVRTLLVDGARAAAVLTERLTVDGETRTFDIAVFLTVADARITSVTVFREGSADLVR